jgi:hypothetical protein
MTELGASPARPSCRVEGGAIRCKDAGQENRRCTHRNPLGIVSGRARRGSFASVERSMPDRLLRQEILQQRWYRQSQAMTTPVLAYQD